MSIQQFESITADELSNISGGAISTDAQLTAMLTPSPAIATIRPSN
jgi:bacteriocin-like protein